MIEIIPASMPHSFQDVQDDANRFFEYVSTVQIDMMDGEYVSTRNWPFNMGLGSHGELKQIIEDGLPFWQKLNYEFDLMIEQPIESLPKLVELGPSRIILHADTFALADMELYWETNPTVRNFVSFGVAVHPDWDLEDCADYIEAFDFVQCMGIAEIGKQGEPFDERTVEMIKAIRVEFPDKPISVDGGVSDETAGKLIQAGATRLVSGSFLHNKPDPQEAIKTLQGGIL